MVLPQLVGSAKQPAVTDSLGNIIKPGFTFKVLNYTELIPYLIAAVKEQQLEIDALSNQLKQSSGNTILQKQSNKTSIILSNENVIILDQNDPNPFNDQTTIHYSIPDNINAAKIVFFNNSGLVLKTIDIKEKGKGSITVYASDLSSGIYSYTLIADGKPVETKKMVKQ